MKLPKLVIIGSSSYIARNVIEYYAKASYSSKLVITSRDLKKCDNNKCFFLDLSCPEIKNLQLLKKGFGHAIIFSAISNIAECENNKEFSKNINVNKTLELANQLSSEGVIPIFLSSDVIFGDNIGNYTENSRPSPINEYGRQKLEIEKQINDVTNGNYLLLRLSKVFSLEKGDGTLLDEMAAKLVNGIFLKEACDQIFCPILVDDLVRIIIRLISAGTTGIINVCGEKALSRYEMATLLAKFLNVDKNVIQRVAIDDLNLGAPRSKNTSMCIDKLQKIINFDFTPLDDCIDTVANSWRRNCND